MPMTQNHIYPKKYDAVYREEKERQAQHLRLVREVKSRDEQSVKIQDFIDEINLMSVATLLLAIAFIVLFLLFNIGTASAQQEPMLESTASGYSMDEGFYTFAEGFNYMHRGEFDKAIERLTDSIAYNSNYASAYAFRAAAYYEIGEYELAILDFNCAIEISPNYESAYRWRGNTHEALGHFILAQQDWQIADQLSTQPT